MTLKASVQRCLFQETTQKPMGEGKKNPQSPPSPKPLPLSRYDNKTKKKKKKHTERKGSTEKTPSVCQHLMVSGVSFFFNSLRF